MYFTEKKDDFFPHVIYLKWQSRQPKKSGYFFYTKKYRCRCVVTFLLMSWSLQIHNIYSGISCFFLLHFLRDFKGWNRFFCDFFCTARNNKKTTIVPLFPANFTEELMGRRKKWRGHAKQHFSRTFQKFWFRMICTHQAHLKTALKLSDFGIFINFLDFCNKCLELKISVPGVCKSCITNIFEEYRKN